MAQGLGLAKVSTQTMKVMQELETFDSLYLATYCSIFKLGTTHGFAGVQQKEPPLMQCLLGQKTVHTVEFCASRRLCTVVRSRGSCSARLI